MRVVLADIKGTKGFVNKDTIVGGFGARFQGFTRTTRWIEHLRTLYQSVASVQVAYLAAIFARAGHEVVFTDGEMADGDLGLVLTSIVDYRREIEWAERARRRHGMRTGFYGAMATHVTGVFDGHSDFTIRGEPESAAMRLAAGEVLTGIVDSPAIAVLDSLPFPAWPLMVRPRGVHAPRSIIPTRSSFPILASRSCPEFCTYCPHRITASYRARTPENVLAEIEYICRRYGAAHLIFRDPLFTEDRGRSVAIAEGIRRERFPVQFECETRLDNLDTELLDTLHAAGLHTISFGVESVQANTLRRVGRRPIPSAHQRSIVEYCRQKGIMTHAFYVFGFLDDTADSIRATIEYAVALDTTFALFKILTPYPGTPLRKHMEHLMTETDLEKFDGLTPTFTHPNLTHEQLRFLLGSAYTRFYIRPSWGWNYFGIRHTYSDWLRRIDNFARERQMRNQTAFLTSTGSKARSE
jgi:radical SAM superfamily enzyme YgiQ (UPF0313 family)